MTLAFVPNQDRTSQQTVAEWAGLDTEQVPDQIWTAPDDSEWNTDAIVSWCRDEDRWSDAKTVLHQPAERICVLGEGAPINFEMVSLKTSTKRRFSFKPHAAWIAGRTFSENACGIEPS